MYTSSRLSITDEKITRLFKSQKEYICMPVKRNTEILVIPSPPYSCGIIVQNNNHEKSKRFLVNSTAQLGNEVQADRKRIMCSKTCLSFSNKSYMSRQHIDLEIDKVKLSKISNKWFSRI